MSGQFPLTDAGGTSAWIRTSPTMRPQTLHRFWDSAGASDPTEGHRRDPDAFAARLEAEHPDQLGPTPTDVHKAFDGWADESRALAHDQAYGRGVIPLGSYPASAPVLPSGYVGHAQATAEVRLAQAGARIAAVLVGLR